ncbi:MAG: 1-deoxy-D-xylulose-5-phosphate reductoisomerase [Sphingobium sp.]|jgi:1-deoxy-D-xylulose-5-phosphate reductoisomerase|uniref:1-deoxy-D-xylulose-5-phosphate reductoisomerase n=1 Tax=Sphingobium sp. TaxID=1912891 RepID=UPI000C5823BF|nr:1-deoxy-D-xylulose-5-phosphate reductoisomerase [Sphingobium sp.]MBU0660522.1 1-deoxy-D-xylulose-5-phosphate reductoisomerase [Alphaproteobacteria bacterium]MBA4755941.1 1-deoxy-D-xylulose-5-phosphate reductoisomerase [Sphingobium sp.]MBS86987.1 1-deoxy-D-xylulose-5-phosphate reductoisomerase [Sphingobium sp.]MBU0869634.1 1-deoxy-D-xylulose-5-phosphate reductoisomerase [Alphaproteobacteria bacterium]MBU1795195.1 1-deoxy-D-xylulose-5-phosphate reductoisomerase [Alphaproteobacteria bacterium]
MTRKVSIFGATGSVGQSTLDLIRRDRDAYDVVALTANSDLDSLAALARESGAKVAVIGQERLYGALKEALAGTGIEAAAGEQALVDVAGAGADWTMAAIVGCAGLRPTMAALKAGGTVALANKESLVSAGGLMMAAAGVSGTTLLPVDSEHNAIFQCLAGSSLEDVARITLTASGGPFRTRSRAEMADITPAQAVAHPNWSMGAKISVDSATMMNKGLELIEAAHLFPVGLDRIEILVHPQSVIHSMVEYRDRSTLAQLGSPDMRIPIAHALAWPQRIATPCQPLDLARIGRLDFEAPDQDRFPALRLTREAAAAGGAMPAILNAANEAAVAAFLGGRIGFLDIAMIVEEVLNRYSAPTPSTIEDVLAADAGARAVAGDVMERLTV